MAIMEREGGMIALIDKALAPLGIGRTRETVAGNVCVVRAPIVRDGKIERGAEAALCISPELRAVHAVDGVVIAPMPVLVAWAV